MQQTGQAAFLLMDACARDTHVLVHIELGSVRAHSKVVGQVLLVGLQEALHRGLLLGAPVPIIVCQLQLLRRLWLCPPIIIITCARQHR